MADYQPPPRRAAPMSSSGSATPEKKTWKDKMKAQGKKAMDKGVIISDKVGGRVNDIAEKKFGTEAFWPVTGDFPKEMDKCARILRAFTVDGIMTEIKPKKGDKTGKFGHKVKMLRKIPAKVFQNCYGVAVFTSMRTGIAPFGGAGGAGVVIAKLEDGSWSAPASITPNNLSTGFLFGIDVYDCVLIIRNQKALESFRTHKFTLGAEIAVAAGPYGGGRAVEAGIEKAPVLSYVRTKGMYAGVELVGQVFVERFEENAAMYHYPGVKAGEILAGKVKVPREAAQLIQALQDAESGRAQREKGNALDTMIGEGPDGQDIPIEEGVDMQDAQMVDFPEKDGLASLNASQGGTPGHATPRLGASSGTHTPDGTRTPEKRALPPPPPRLDGSSTPERPYLPPPPSHPSRMRGPSSQPPPPAEVTEPITFPDEKLVPPTFSRPPLGEQHSSMSQYSQATEGEKAPSLNEVRQTASEMERLDLQDENVFSDQAVADSPVTLRSDTAQEPAVKESEKGVDRGTVHRAPEGEEDGPSPPGYDESLR